MCGRAFPPADDFAVERLDIMQLLVKHPQATYFWRVRGDSMREAGVDDGSIIGGSGHPPKHGSIVVAMVDGSARSIPLPARRSHQLCAANPTRPGHKVPKDSQTIEVWGVVVGSIKLFSS